MLPVVTSTTRPPMRNASSAVSERRDQPARLLQQP